MQNNNPFEYLDDSEINRTAKNLRSMAVNCLENADINGAAKYMREHQLCMAEVYTRRAAKFLPKDVPILTHE